MVRVDRESQLAAGRPGQGAEQLVGCFDGRATSLADEMCVGERRELVSGRSMAEVRMHNHAHALKLFEVAVDGGDVHVRSPRAHGLGELVSAEVALGLEQDLEQDPTRGVARPPRARTSASTSSTEEIATPRLGGRAKGLLNGSSPGVVQLCEPVLGRRLARVGRLTLPRYLQARSWTLPTLATSSHLIRVWECQEREVSCATPRDGFEGSAEPSRRRSGRGSGG